MITSLTSSLFSILAHWCCHEAWPSFTGWTEPGVGRKKSWPIIARFSTSVPGLRRQRQLVIPRRRLVCLITILSSRLSKRTRRDIWPRRPCLYHDLKYWIESRLGGPTRTLVLSEPFSKAGVMVYCFLPKIHCVFVHFEKRSDCRHSCSLPLFQRTNWC